MCFDTEKTQAPQVAGLGSSEHRLRQEKEFHARQREERFSTAVNEASIGGGSTGRAYSEQGILAELFSYHPPTPNTLPKYAAINQAAKNFAEVILQNCPPSADRSDAIRIIRESRMTANAAIALDGLSL